MLYRYMKRKCFVFELSSNHYMYTRKGLNVIHVREKYLFWVENYRKVVYNICYEDETRLNKKRSPHKVWKFGKGRTVKQKVSTEKGERFIVSHTRYPFT